MVVFFIIRVFVFFESIFMFKVWVLRYECMEIYLFIFFFVGRKKNFCFVKNLENGR